MEANGNRGGAEGTSRGRRRGHAPGRGGPVSREVMMSKKLSWLLRHGAEKEGLQLGKGGYLNLRDVIENRNVRSMGRPTLAEIRGLVADNDKQRYTLIHISKSESPTGGASELPVYMVPTPEEVEIDSDPSHYLIRANQGHSLKVDDEGLTTPITLQAGNLPDVVVHGTRHDAWPKILASGGLKPMTRNHVHFAIGVPESLKSSTASENVATDGEVTPLPEDNQIFKVMSGMRNTSTILIFLNLRAALEGGLKFSLSANGVVLSEGSADGLVGIEFFEKVEEKGGNVLVKDGKVIAEATTVRALNKGTKT